MSWQERISVKAAVRNGKPCIKGTRITVYDVLEYMAGGMSEDEILADFPDLTREDIRACLAFAGAATCWAACAPGLLPAMPRGKVPRTVQEGRDSHHVRLNLVDKAVAEHKDLAEGRPGELRDHATALDQRGKRIRGRQGLLEDPEGTFSGSLGDEGERLIE